MSYDISIILVNYNSEECLVDCIKSIVKYTNRLNYEIIIVDNFSPGKENLSTIKNNFDFIKIIYNKKNCGFGSGINIGVKESNGKYLMITNPDVIFTDNTIEKLFNVLENDATNLIGAISPIFYDANGKMLYTYNKFPGFQWEFAEAVGLDGTRRITEKLNNRLKKEIKKNKLFFVDTFTGACIFLKKELFDDVNGFDENMFLYYEDTDLLKRIKDRGLKNALITNCSIIHTPNTSTMSVDGEYFYYYHLTRSKIIYYHKHFSLIKRSLFKTMHILGILIRFLALPFRKNAGNVRLKKSSLYKKLLRMYIFNFEI